MVCSGLGTTRRGYEVFFDSFYRRVQGAPELDVRLFKGGGRSMPGERRVWNLPRRSRAAEWLGETLQVGMPELGRGYYIEQASFLIGLIPHLLTGRPDLVYFSDKDLGDLLWRWRKVAKQDFKLLFRNGGPYPPPYPRFDYVQQVTRPLFQAALRMGCSETQQHLLPAGFDVPGGLGLLDEADRFALRTRLQLPKDRPIVLSVSAINAVHKRLDYVVRELSMLPEPRPHLVILGQPDAETPKILRLCHDLLGASHFTVETVGPEYVNDYYRASDVFVLASTREGFGRVWVEALSHGLPCIAHDFEVSRYVLGDHGMFGDLEQEGALAALLHEQLQRRFSPELARARHQSAYERFSWAKLVPEYMALLTQCAQDTG